MENKKGPWIVAIGASGPDGFNDIKNLLEPLPPTLAAIIMVVLHRSWDGPTRLQAILAQTSRLPVVIAAQSEYFEAGAVYIGEPSRHLTIVTDSFGALINDPHRHYMGRTVDLLFNSVAAHAGTRMIGVVLSGSLDDGSRGLAAIHKMGGMTMVLTPTHPRQPGMPENAISYNGPIHLIGSSLRIAKGICAACKP